MTVKSFIFLLQKINFTDQFYAPPVVMVTAERVNNDSHLSGCNAITAWVEVRKETDWSTAYFTPVWSKGFFKILQNHTSSVIVFYKGMANYLNKSFIKKKKTKKQYENKGRQLVIRSSTCVSSILNFSWMWLTAQFSFHLLFWRIFLNYFG